MENIEIPHDEETLKKALMSASVRLGDEEGLQERLIDKIAKVSSFGSMSEFNLKVAEFHGITVVDLINSPNYEKLKYEFTSDSLSKIRKIYLEEGFEEKESWALLCIGLGKLID